jgi:O-antigen/teichoic acid export membrane protein
LYKNLLKQTAIYGLATVIPRMFSFFLVPFYTQLLPKEDYGKITEIFAYIIFFNVILSYGMETAFFRFYNSESNKKKVVDTATISILISTIIFFVIFFLFRESLVAILSLNLEYVIYGLFIIIFDAFVIIPFSKLRANKEAKYYSFLKVSNVIINLCLNIFFLSYLPKIVESVPNSVLKYIYYDNFQIGYIFISNMIASAVTLCFFLPDYFHIKWNFDYKLLKKMLVYGLPILIAGIAFAINEQLDKILLANLLPKNIAAGQVGVYSACYKLGLFMVLYRTAYTLGIEPFIFSYSSSKNSTTIYANMTKYFVIFGSLILLFVIVFVDVLKVFMIRDTSYWEGMKVVPLIILANFFLGIYYNLSVWYKVIDKTYIGAYISIAGAILTLTLNFILIPIMGYYGSAVATISAYGLMMIISYYLGNKYNPIPYEINKICGSLFLSIVFSIISFYYFRENYYVGGLLLLILMIYSIYIEKNFFTKIVKGILKKV